MSHAPPPLCWTCAKPLFGGSISETRLPCDYCAFHSCGDCLLGHYRNAHPSEFMKEIMPTLRHNNLNASYPFGIRPPARDNVIPITRPRKGSAA